LNSAISLIDAVLVFNANVYLKPLAWCKHVQH